MAQVCFLFGRRDTPLWVREHLDQALRRQAEAGTEVFVLGCWGQFETVALDALEQVRERFPNIRIMTLEEACPTPAVPKRFANTFAHRHMIQHCDSLICCPYKTGNMQLLLELARSRNIPVEDLSQKSTDNP